MLIVKITLDHQMVYVFEKNFQKQNKMDITTMIILENKLDIPLDVLRYLNEYIKYEEIKILKML